VIKVSFVPFSLLVAGKFVLGTAVSWIVLLFISSALFQTSFREGSCF